MPSCMELDFVEQGYRFVSKELDKGESEVTISDPEGNMVKRFRWPTYKIFNISAHARDIVEGLKEGTSAGLYIAGSTGLGGNVYQGGRNCYRKPH